MDLNIRLARSGADIDACGSVMRELRPHVPEDRFPALVRDQERTGYRLAMASTTVEVVAVAGFRIDSSLLPIRGLALDRAQQHRLGLLHARTRLCSFAQTFRRPPLATALAPARLPLPFPALLDRISHRQPRIPPRLPSL